MNEPKLTDFDFMRRVPERCPDCHYPFAASWPGRIKVIECPVHRPAHWPADYDPNADTRFPL